MTIILLFGLISVAFNSSLNATQVPFSFEKKPLVEIIDFLAQKKNINIIPPQNASEADILKKQVVTYRPLGTETISLNNAWNMLQTFLRGSGFSISYKSKNIYAIVKTETIKNNTVALYVNSDTNSLPASQETIRYIYYLKNLKAPDKTDSGLGQLIKELLSTTGIFISDTKSNALIFVDRADIIASIIYILKEADSEAFYETISVVPLYNTSANEVVRAFNLLKLASGDKAEFQPIKEPKTAGEFFGQKIKIIPDRRTNSVILMGTNSAIEKVSEFISQAVDVLPESGESILHVYDLQYMDAVKFAPILQSIVSLQISSKQAKQANQLGPNYFFTGVQVVAQITSEIKEASNLPNRMITEKVTLDQRAQVKDLVGLDPKSKALIGGNRLLIAAVKADWDYIKDLIKKLDTPQPQVILEVAVIDFSYQQNNKIASTDRNLTNPCCELPGVNYLASHISPPNLVLGNNPTTLAQDLLRVVATPNVISTLAPSSTLISLNDPATPGIWGLIQVLSRYLISDIISHPFLIASNNQKSFVESQNIRRGSGTLLTSDKASFIIPVQDIIASIRVELVPRISSPDRLLLDIGVTVEDFVGPTLDRLTRQLATTANMASGQILAMGGLIRSDFNESQTKTPLIADVPIFGWLFKSDDQRVVKSNIIILVCPTILMPKTNTTATTYTKNKIINITDTLDEDYLGSSVDPIAHLFFRNYDEQFSKELIGDYLNKTDNLQDLPVNIYKPILRTIKKSSSAADLKEILAHEQNPLMSPRQSGKGQLILNHQ